MSTDAYTPAQLAPADAGPLGPLPQLAGRQVALERLIRHAPEVLPLRSALRWLDAALGTPIEVGGAEVHWRAAGLGRSGVNAHLAWPRLSARLALGIDTPAAHAIVDRLLGFDRLPGEERLQVTPVEWGILTFVAGRTLAELDGAPGPLGPWDLSIDRVGPEPFATAGLGPIVTIRWPIRVGPAAGTARLWLPEMLVAQLNDAAPPPRAAADPAALRARFGAIAGRWRLVAGSATMPRGLGRLRAGGVLPVDGSTLRGTPGSPSGPMALVLEDGASRWSIAVDPVPGTGGGRVVPNAPVRREPAPRGPLPVSAATDPSPDANPADIPVTLTVELGRLNLPLARLADLKPGDVLELGRHSREPVELTSNGRLVARGELVQIDTELGVRVTNVLL